MPYESLYRYGQVRDGQFLTGFKDIYNMADCGLDVATLYLHLSTLSGDLSAFPNSFRVFIPPGTIYAGITAYMPINAVEGLVVRYMQPPDAAYVGYAFDAILWDASVDVNLSLLKHRDVYLKNRGGHAYVLPAFSIHAPFTTEDSGWVYIQKIPFSSGTIHDFKVTIDVNLDVYWAWYNKVSCVGSKYYWNGDGDPYIRDQGEIGSLNMMAKYAGPNWENSPPIDSDYESILSLVGNDPSKHAEGIYNGIYYYFGDHPEKCMAIKYLEQITNGCWYLWIKNYGDIKLNDCKVYFDF